MNDKNITTNNINKNVIKLKENSENNRKINRYINNNSNNITTITR